VELLEVRNYKKTECEKREPKQLDIELLAYGFDSVDEACRKTNKQTNKQGKVPWAMLEVVLVGWLVVVGRRRRRRNWLEWV